jgi:peptidoglycan/LPS O-acetylase OafA/YrhL
VVLAAGATPVRKPSKVLEKAALVSFALFITNEFVRVIYFGVEHALAARLGFGQPLQWAVWSGGLAAAVLFAVAFHYLVDWPSQAWIKARMADGPARARRSLAALAPRPDPAFDPFRATASAAPRVREIVLRIGPAPGAAHSRGLEGRGELVWG